MKDDVDRLIHGHLEGALSDEEARALGQALREDPSVRRRLAEMAFDQAQLRDLLTPAELGGELETGVEASAPTRRAAPGARTFLATAAALLLAVGTALVVRALRSGPEAPVAPASKPSETRKDPPPAALEPVALDALEMDVNGDGRITRGEWSAWFKRVDADGDGRITADELKAAGMRGEESPSRRRDPRK